MKIKDPEKNCAKDEVTVKTRVKENFLLLVKNSFSGYPQGNWCEKVSNFLFFFISLSLFIKILVTLSISLSNLFTQEFYVLSVPFVPVRSDSVFFLYLFTRFVKKAWELVHWRLDSLSFSYIFKKNPEKMMHCYMSYFNLNNNNK